ncbi:hypothetical protein [Algibacter sp. L4_22]|uniref:hypothetical protein n=1 Tax=Algibacter sp. L4_22 TaxID=2942477 RepID=UPI00201B8B04|nr:hypothetical protein [Algibacter sp. L4_22]MCL5128599.1 hypothetical protein [Algibacter sp. L4_22]
MVQQLSKQTMHYKKALLFFLMPLTMISQNITGKIYDSESTVQGAKIFNKTKNSVTFSDEKGSFNLIATRNDSLVITSLFHQTKYVKIDAFYLENTIVVELTKQVNNLPEVLLAENANQSGLKALETNSDLGTELASDLKNNSETWYKNMPKSGIDFVAIASLVAKLLKSKKAKPQLITTIEYKTLDSLFSSSHKLFNKSLLINDFKIPDEYIPLFFDYCDSQSINSNLLLEKNDFMLLDKLLKSSNDFLEMLKTTEQN